MYIGSNNQSLQELLQWSLTRIKNIEHWAFVFNNEQTILAYVECNNENYEKFHLVLHLHHLIFGIGYIWIYFDNNFKILIYFCVCLVHMPYMHIIPSSMEINILTYRSTASCWNGMWLSDVTWVLKKIVHFCNFLCEVAKHIEIMMVCFYCQTKQLRVFPEMHWITFALLLE